MSASAHIERRLAAIVFADILVVPDALDQTVRQTSNRQLILLKRNINEPEFATAVVAAFRSVVGRAGARRRVAR